MRNITRLPIAVAILLLCGVGSLPAENVVPEPIPANEKRLVVRSYKLNDFKRVLDGQWQGITVASDAKVYFASSTHSEIDGAAFFQYDPKAKKVRMLCRDITRVCGDDPNETPHGKIHSDIVEHDGWLYFTTYISSAKPGFDDIFPGSHVIGYELATGRFRDLGLVRRNFVSYSGIGVDRKRNRLYVYVTPFNKKQVKRDVGPHLYLIDIASGKKRDLGLLLPGVWRHSFWFFVDRRGDCWFTISQSFMKREYPDFKTKGTLYCARAETGKIDRFHDALPPVYSLTKDEVSADQKAQDSRWWDWGQPLDGDRYAFKLFRGGRLWIFDATKDIASGKAFKSVRHIGETHLGVATDGDRVYFARRTSRRPSRQHRLMSVPLNRGANPAIVNHGMIVDQEGRGARRVTGMATDGKGFVYMVGDWHLKPGEKGTLRAARSAGPNEVRFKWLRRGQFFAVADLSGGKKK